MEGDLILPRRSTSYLPACVMSPSCFAVHDETGYTRMERCGESKGSLRRWRNLLKRLVMSDGGMRRRSKAVSFQYDAVSYLQNFDEGCHLYEEDLGRPSHVFNNVRWDGDLDRHEIVGEVTEVGSQVQKFKVGDKVGVGYLVGSCKTCETCANDLENYCPKSIPTCGAKYHDGTTTYGGYSDIMVADEAFVIRIPENLPLEGAAPPLCAGITTYSPLRYYGLDKPGMHVGVVGLGGLGHVAVKFAKALGVKVTVISTSINKKDEAIDNLGADFFLVSRDQDQMQAAMGTLDGIIDTVSAVHPLANLVSLLKVNGKLVMLGAPEKSPELPVFSLIAGRKTIAGSLIGGVKEIQEMIDLAAKHSITADVEVISIDYVNTAMERLAKGDVRYRFVIDIGNTLKPEPLA